MIPAQGISDGRETSPPLVISGFHRSGTSLLAKYLGACGLYLGLRPTQARLLECGSLSGHSEDPGFQGFFRRLLGERGLKIFATEKPAPPIELTPEERREFDTKVAERQPHEPWGFKAPLTCLFLEALGDALSNAVFLFIIRDPLLSVGSLIRRDRDPAIVHNPQRGFRSWQVYNELILRFAEEHPERCSLITLDLFLSSAEETLDPVFARFGLPLQTAPLNTVFERRYLHLEVPESVARLAHQNLPCVQNACELYRRMVTMAPKSSRKTSWKPPAVAWSENQGD